MRYLIACLAFGALATLAAVTAYNRQADALAYACAMRSERTDSAIAECYHRYSRPVPREVE